MIAHLQHIEIAYEDYVRDQSDWNSRLTRFLGVPDQDLHSDLKKISSERLREAIGNFLDIEPVLKDSRYAYCLDAEA